MIQRIQSLYLVLVAALSALQCFVPAGGVWMPERVGYYALQFQGAVFHGTQAQGTEILFSTIWLSAMAVLVGVLALVTLFLFKKRILQVRLCVINAVLCAGYYGMFFWHIWVLKANVSQLCGDNAGMYADWGLAIPLVNLILICMAARAILKDEALVRSLDRLR